MERSSKPTHHAQSNWYDIRTCMYILHLLIAWLVWQDSDRIKTSFWNHLYHCQSQELLSQELKRKHVLAHYSLDKGAGAGQITGILRLLPLSFTKGSALVTIPSNSAAINPPDAGRFDIFYANLQCFVHKSKLIKYSLPPPTSQKKENSYYR